jgi:hypothetical protein
MPVVRKIVRDSDGYRFTSLVLGIINSTPFQMRAPVDAATSRVLQAKRKDY